MPSIQSIGCGSSRRGPGERARARRAGRTAVGARRGFFRRGSSAAEDAPRIDFPPLRNYARCASCAVPLWPFLVSGLPPAPLRKFAGFAQFAVPLPYLSAVLLRPSVVSVKTRGCFVCVGGGGSTGSPQVAAGAGRGPFFPARDEPAGAFPSRGKPRENNTPDWLDTAGGRSLSSAPFL